MTPEDWSAAAQVPLGIHGDDGWDGKNGAPILGEDPLTQIYIPRLGCFKYFLNIC